MLLGSSRHYPWFILEENRRCDDDDDDNEEEEEEDNDDDEDDDDDDECNKICSVKKKQNWSQHKPLRHHKIQIKRRFQNAMIPWTDTCWLLPDR